MIEEAAGTRLYESKKESAQRTIEKKDAKLKEIDTVSLSFLPNPRTYSCISQDLSIEKQAANFSRPTATSCHHLLHTFTVLFPDILYVLIHKIISLTMKTCYQCSFPIVTFLFSDFA